MSIYKLQGLGTGGEQNGVSSLDVQFDGTITAIHANLTADIDADLENANCEASFLSTNTIATNDTRGSLISLAMFTSAAAAGQPMNAVNSSVSGLTIPVNAGERVFLHFNSSASTTSSAQIYLYVDDKQDANLRRRR